MVRIVCRLFDRRHQFNKVKVTSLEGISLLDQQPLKVQILGLKGNYLPTLSMDSWKFQFVFIFTLPFLFCVGKQGCPPYGSF
jgi:hypothetical protein